MEYVLDANIFVEAAQRYYGLDFAPAFWSNLLEQASKGKIKSIDRVQTELERGTDDLTAWATANATVFASTDEDGVIDKYRAVMQWVNEQAQFSDAAKSNFAGGADGWLIAYAAVKGCTVVTHEQGSPQAKSRVPIPNVCSAFGVPSAIRSRCCGTSAFGSPEMKRVEDALAPFGIGVHGRFLRTRKSNSCHTSGDWRRPRAQTRASPARRR